MEHINLSLPEILSLIGLIQCLYLLVYITLRARLVQHFGLPLLYFGVLALAFASDIGAGRIQTQGDWYFIMQWALWFLGPPLSVLLIIQLSDSTRPPPLADMWVFLLLPLSFVLSFLAAQTAPLCNPGEPCEALHDMLGVTGLMSGTISLLVIFSKKNLFKNIARQKQGQARYWLIFALIILNIALLGTMLLNLMGRIEDADVMPLRDLFGLGFVYLASTSLLRLYPGASKSSSLAEQSLDENETALAGKIEKLINLDKVYHEPTYSRADLARECGAPEATVSRVINIHFGKSFPQLMNEHRIEDAKRLLVQTDAPVSKIASEVGFNSLPSFNRVFKDMTGDSPTSFRKAAAE